MRTIRQKAKSKDNARKKRAAKRSEACKWCNNGISYRDRKGNSDHMNAHTCEKCSGTGKTPPS